MNLQEKKEYVNENLANLPLKEKMAFDYNFACVYTKNSVGMESGHTAKLEDVVAAVKGYQIKLDENLKRDLYNHYQTFLSMKKDLENNPSLELSEDYLKDLHASLVKGVKINEDQFIGGLYRNVNISVKGSKYIPCDHVKVYKRMKDYFEKIQSNELTGLDKIIYSHLQLSKIHPFLDGNGRLSRLILNFELMKEGYLPISIPAKRREEYFATLEAFKVDKNSKAFADFLIELLNKEYDRLIDLIIPNVA